MKGKRLLSLLLAVIMIVGMVPASTFALEAGDPDSLTERYINESTGKEFFEPQTSKTTEAKTPQPVKGYVYTDRYTEDTEHIYSRDDLTYLYGYPDKTVRGERYLSRAEAAAIFCRLYDGYYPAFTRNMMSKTFSDVSADAWYYEELRTLYNVGIINGYADGTFKPNEPVTRAEFAYLATAFAELPRIDKTVFSDVTTEHWAYQFVAAAYDAGWISGYGDGTYKPDNEITRAETVTMVNAVINRSVTVEKLKELGVENPYTDLVETYWAFSDLICATVVHTAADWHDIINVHANKLDEYAQGPVPVFSEEYKQRKVILLAGRKKKHRHHKMAALIAALLICLSVLAACTEPIRQFFIEAYEQFTSYFSTGPEYAIADLTIEFGYIPDGYTLTSEIVQDIVYAAIYQQEGDDSNVLTISVQSSSSSSNHIDNEDTVQQEYTVNGHPCIITRKENQPEAALYCNTDTAVIEIVSILSDDELIKLLEEMKITVN